MNIVEYGMAEKVYVVGLGNRYRKFWRHAVVSYVPKGATVTLIDSSDAVLIEAANDLQLLRDDLSVELLPSVYGIDIVRHSYGSVGIISTPDFDHFSTISHMLNLGIDCIVEKPVCTTIEDIDRLALLESECAASVFAAHNFRFAPQNRRFSAIVKKGELGILKNIDMNYRLTSDHMESYFKRWHKWKENSGGLEVTKSCHHVDIMSVISQGGVLESNTVLKRTELGQRFFRKYGGDLHDSIEAAMTFEGGVRGSYSLECTSVGTHYFVRVSGTEGFAKLESHSDRDMSTITVESNKSSRTEVILKGQGGHGGADQSMASSIVRSLSNLPGLSSARNSLALTR